MVFAFVHSLLCIGALVLTSVISRRGSVRIHNTQPHPAGFQQWKLQKLALLEYGITDLLESGETEKSSLVETNSRDSWTDDPKQWPALLAAVMENRYKSFGVFWTGDLETGRLHFAQLINKTRGYNILILAAGSGIMSSALLRFGSGTGMKVVDTDYTYLDGGVGMDHWSKAGFSNNSQFWTCGADNTKLPANRCIKDFTDKHGQFDLVLMNNGMCSHGPMLTGDPMRICGGCAATDLPGFFEELTALTTNGGTWLFINLNTVTDKEDGMNEPPKFFQDYLSKTGYNKVFQYDQFDTDKIRNGLPWTWVQKVSKRPVFKRPRPPLTRLQDQVQRRVRRGDGGANLAQRPGIRVLRNTKMQQRI